MPLTAEQKQKLIELYPVYTSAELAQLLGCSASVIKNNAYDLKLKKNINKGCFKKGLIPHNKGKRMKEYCKPEIIETIRKTQFKKGNLPHNTKHDGFISLRKDKRTGIIYKYIRIEKAKFELMHRVIWQQHNGEIPKNHVVVFKDGNSLNCVIENLEMITMEENMKRNTIQRYPEELQTSLRLRSKLKKLIKQKSNN